jgi:predicted kinase
MKKELIMLVGVPGSGKSTWRKSHYDNRSKDRTAIFSTDDIIEDLALQYGFTYNEIFKDTISLAEKVCFKRLKAWCDSCDRIVIDRTNLTKKGRAKFLNIIPDEFERTAIIFPYPDDIEERLKSRPGKVLPLKLVQDMYSKYEAPSLDEGFDFIY